MPEEANILELQEQLEKAEAFDQGWSRYLALSTALIAVISALISLKSSTLAEQAVLIKNEAILFQSQASDQWNYYQAKGIKKNIAELFAGQTPKLDVQIQISKYQKEQTDIQAQAQALEQKAKDANEQSAKLFEQHHRIALGVTFLQIAVALSAISSLLRKKTFWHFSLAIAAAGVLMSAFGWFNG